MRQRSDFLQTTRLTERLLLLVQQLLLGLFNGVHNGDIAGAAAKIASDGFFDLLTRWIRILLEQRIGAHEHAGRAETALHSAVIDEAALEYRADLGFAESLDGHDVRVLHLAGGNETARDRNSVDHNGTCAAFADAAAFFCATEGKVIAKDVEHTVARIRLDRVRFSIQPK